MLERLGIAQDLKSKIKLFSLVVEPEDVFQRVARDEIDMQIGSMSEIVISPGVDLVGPLPARICSRYARRLYGPWWMAMAVHYRGGAICSGWVMGFEASHG
jgi:hypothetical protein